MNEAILIIAIRATEISTSLNFCGFLFIHSFNIIYGLAYFLISFAHWCSVLTLQLPQFQYWASLWYICDLFDWESISYQKPLGIGMRGNTIKSYPGWYLWLIFLNYCLKATDRWIVYWKVFWNEKEQHSRSTRNTYMSGWGTILSSHICEDICDTPEFL